MFAIAESHLSPDVDSRLVDIEGFSLLRHDRNRDGGGLVLYVHNSLKARIVSTSNTTIPTDRPMVPEFLICSVQQGRDPPILVAVIYRPLHIPFNKGTNLIDTLTTCVDDFSHKIILGDLNANLLSTSGDAKFVRQVANDLSLKIVHHGATHHKQDSHTWIDVILVDENDEILSADNRVAPFPSLHNIIDVHIQIHNTSLAEQPTFSYRDIKSIDQIELISLLQSYDWLQLDCEDINTKLACLSDNLLCVIDQLAPSKTVKL